MFHTLSMDDRPAVRPHEVRDTILKSGLTGVAATVLAVTMWSPAGLGGLIGTSVAAGFGLGADPNANSATAGLAPYPTPLSQAEITEIHGRLMVTNAALDNMRAATDAEIDFIRSLAVSDNSNVLAFAPMPNVAHVGAGMSVATQNLPEAVSTAAAAPVEIRVEPIQVAEYSSYAPSIDRDPNLELASLLLSDELR